MKKILPLLIGAIMAIIGMILWTGNQGSSLKDKEEFYRNLCENGVKTIANIKDEYTQKAGKAIKIVSYKYDYTVDGVKYTEEVHTNKLPSTIEFEITYLPDNPSVSSKSNVCGTYEKIKNDTSSSTLMYLGITMFFIGLVTSWGSFKSLVKR